MQTACSGQNSLYAPCFVINYLCSSKNNIYITSLLCKQTISLILTFKLYVELYGRRTGIKRVYGLHVLETDCTLVGISCRLRVVLETLVYRRLELTSQSVMHCSMMGNLPFPTGYYSGNTEIDGQLQVCTRNVAQRGFACQFGTLNPSDLLYNNVELYNL